MSGDSFPNRKPIDEAARMVGGSRDEDDTGSYIAPPPFSLKPFDHLGWTLVASLVLAGIATAWVAWS